MPDTLTEADYCLLAPLQHERLRSHFSALQDAALVTRADATLVVSCDWEAIRALHRQANALLDEDWDSFAHCVYLCTGCSSTSFYVDHAPVLTQTRAIQLQQSMRTEDKQMVAVAERAAQHAAAIKDMTTAAAAVISTKPPRSIADVVQELTDLIAEMAVAKVQARSAMLVSNGMASTPEQPTPVEPTPAQPTKLPKVRLQGIFIPTKSNWTQAAKRYLKAVDPSGEATKALEAIVDLTPIGQAHIERALREYPAADRDATRTKLYNGFLKVASERGMTTDDSAS